MTAMGKIRVSSCKICVKTRLTTSYKNHRQTITKIVAKGNIMIHTSNQTISKWGTRDPTKIMEHQQRKGHLWQAEMDAAAPLCD